MHFTSSQFDWSLTKTEDGIEPHHKTIDVAIIVDCEFELIGKIEIFCFYLPQINIKYCTFIRTKDVFWANFHQRFKFYPFLEGFVAESINLDYKYLTLFQKSVLSLQKEMSSIPLT